MWLFLMFLLILMAGLILYLIGLMMFDTPGSVLMPAGFACIVVGGVGSVLCVAQEAFSSWL